MKVSRIFQSYIAYPLIKVNIITKNIPQLLLVGVDIIVQRIYSLIDKCTDITLGNNYLQVFLILMDLNMAFKF